MVDRIRLQAVFFSVIMVLSMVAIGGTAAAGTVAPADTVDEPIESFDAPDVDAVESVDVESTDLDSDDADVEVHELTLVSGHTVEVLDDGEQLEVSLEPTEDAEAVEVVATEKGGTYVVPDGVDFDVVSEELFNVELLIEEGLTDGETDGIPVIVTYDDATVSTTTTGIDGFEPDTEYDIINGAAGTISKDDAETATATTEQSSAVDGVFLDRQDEVRMDDARERTGVEAAWDEYNVTGEGQTIAILDTGVDADHPDFDDRVVDQEDFSGDGLGDENGHGTHVAGIAAGSGDLSDGQYTGVAPEAEIMDVKVLGDFGTGFRSDIIEGMEYAVDNDADIISMSLGGGFDGADDPYQEAIANAYDADVPVVASAGNSGPDFETVGSPAAVEQAIAVGSSDDDEFVFEYSSAGPAEFTYAMKPEVSAPGTEIEAAGSQDAGEAPYTQKTGTSMAAPHVSGLVALLEEEKGDLDVSTIENMLVSTADFDDDERVYRQGGGEAHAPSLLGSDIIVHDAVNSFGLYDEATTESDVIAVENVGNETHEFDIDATLTNEEADENLDDQISVNTTSVTVEPGETEYVEFEFDTEGAFGYNAGKVMFDGEDADYHAILGFTKALEVTVEKHLHSDSVSPATDGDYIRAWDGDTGFIYDELGADWTMVDDDVAHHSFLIFDEEAELSFWSSGQLEAEEGQLQGDVVQTIAEDVHVDTDDSHVTLDETETVERTFDTSELYDDPFLDVFETDSYDATLYANDDEISGSFSQGFSGDFGIVTTHVTPVDDSHVTNVSSAALFYPEYQTDEGIDSDDVYWFYEPTTAVDAEGEAFTVDPDADHVGAEHVEWHRHKEDQLYGFSDHVWPVDQESFPVFLSFAIVSDLHEDVDEQTWYRSTEAASYEETWYDDGSFAGDDNEWRYDRTVGLVMDDGEDLHAPFDRSPVTAGVSTWHVDDDGDMEATVHPYVDQGDEAFTPYEFDNDNPNDVRLWLDDDLVLEDDFVGSAATVSGEDLMGSTVGLEIEGQTLAETSRESHAVTYYEAHIDGETDTPPMLESVDIDGLGLSNEAMDGSVEINVDVSQYADADTLDAFSAYYASADADHTPFEDGDGWYAADVEHVEGTTYAVHADVDAMGDNHGLSLALHAVDEDGSPVEATSFGVANFEEAPAVVNQGAPDRVDSGDEITATVDVTELERVQTSLHESSTVSEDELTLFHGSTINAFDQWRAFDEPATVDDWPITVETADDTVGSVVLEHTFRDDHGDEVTIVTGPTAVYDEPLVVGDSDDATVDTIQEAVDLAPEGTTVYVEDGTYEESVHVTTDGLSIMPFDDDAEVTIEAPYDADTTVLIDGAHDTHVDDVTIHAGGADGVVATDDAIDAYVDAPTVTNVTVEDADTAVGLHDAVDAHTEGVSTMDSSYGVAVHGGEGAHVEDLHAEETGTGLVAEDAGSVHAAELHADEVDTGTFATGETHLMVEDTTVMNATDAAVQTVGAHAGVDVDDLHAEGVEIGVHAANFAHATVTDSTVTDATHGIRLDDGATAEATLTDVSAEVGVYADGADAIDSEVHHNDFAGSDQVAWVDTDHEFDLRLNHVGEREGGETIVEGTTTYDPFLTNAPEEIDFERTDIGTDLHLEAGDTYTVGVPGPTTQGVEEAFGAFDGAIYAFEDGAWELVTNGDLSALDAFAVVPEEDVRVTMTFEAEDGIPPGPGASGLDEGWNLVASPTYDGVESAFGQSTADIGLAMGLMESPHGQLGPAGELDGTHVFDSGDGPHVSAFEGTFVFVEEDGQQPAFLTSDVTIEGLYDQLGLEYEDHDDDDDGEYDTLSSPPAIVN